MVQMDSSSLPRRSSYQKLGQNGSEHRLKLTKTWILTFLLLILYAVQLVDPRPIVCGISSKRNLERCQELVHPRQQGLWPKVWLSMKQFQE